MRKLVKELFILLAIGGLLWAAFAYLVNMPENPSLISAEKEKVLGEKYTDVILSFHGFTRLEDAQIDSVLEDLANKLVDLSGQDDYQFRIWLVENEMINAFALPGGNMIITTGLVRFCETPEELFAVLAHEAGHIVERHIITRLVRDLGIELLTSGNSYVLAEIGKTILSTGYNRKQEDEADLYACRILDKAGVEPRALATLFRKLNENSGSELLAKFEIVSSHPNLEKRIRNVLSYEPENDEFSGEELFSLGLFKEKIEAAVTD